MPSYQSVKGLPVVSAGKGEPMGTVMDLIIEEKKLRVEWIQLSDDRLIGGHDRWLAARDVGHIDDAALVAAPDARLTAQNPLPADHLVASSKEMIGKRVISDNGEELGQVVDYSFAANGMQIVSLSMPVESQHELIPDRFSLDLNVYRVEMNDVVIMLSR